MTFTNYKNHAYGEQPFHNHSHEIHTLFKDNFQTKSMLIDNNLSLIIAMKYIHSSKIVFKQNQWLLFHFWNSSCHYYKLYLDKLQKINSVWTILFKLFL